MSVPQMIPEVIAGFSISYMCTWCMISLVLCDRREEWKYLLCMTIATALAIVMARWPVS